VADISSPSATSLAQSDLFVMHDWLSTDSQEFSHVPGGTNVLLMDGHVEFLKCPNPCSEAMAPDAALISAN